MAMTYEKIQKHQAFFREKSETLGKMEFDFSKTTLRNKRLMQLNNMIMEKLIELNNQTMKAAFSEANKEGLGNTCCPEKSKNAYQL